MNFKLKTKRLRLTPVTFDDAEDIYLITGDYETAKNANMFLTKSLFEVNRRILQNFLISRRYLFYEFAVRRKQRLIGLVSVWYENNKNFIGFCLNKDFAGNGYMIEAVKKVVKWSFKFLKLKEVYAHVFYNNFKSKKLLLKTGFIKTGANLEYEVFVKRG